MSVKQTLKISWSDSSLARLRTTLTVSVEADGEDTRDVTVNDGVPALVNIDFAALALLSCYILTDQTIQIITNEGTGPGDTFDITAGVPFLWLLGGGVPCPFTLDVGTMTIHYDAGTGGAAQARVSLLIVADATP